MREDGRGECDREDSQRKLVEKLRDVEPPDGWEEQARARFLEGYFETVDPAPLHLRGEFIKSNLGTTVGGNGAVIVRIVVVAVLLFPAVVTLMRSFAA